MTELLATITPTALVTIASTSFAMAGVVRIAHDNAAKKVDLGILGDELHKEMRVALFQLDPDLQPRGGARRLGLLASATQGMLALASVLAIAAAVLGGARLICAALSFAALGASLSMVVLYQAYKNVDDVLRWKDRAEAKMAQRSLDAQQAATDSIAQEECEVDQLSATPT